MSGKVPPHQHTANPRRGSGHNEVHSQSEVQHDSARAAHSTSRRSSTSSKASFTGPTASSNATRQVAPPRSLSRSSSIASWSSQRSLPHSSSGFGNDKIVVLIRHAQSQANAAGGYRGDTTMLDPALSDKGIQQAKNIDKLFPKLKERLMKNGIILASPMRRAFLTMAYAFPHLADNQTAYELWPLLLEAKEHNSAKGSSKEVLAAAYSASFPWLNFDSLKEGWSDKTGLLATDKPARLACALHIRKTVRARKEKVIVLISHSGTLRTVADKYEDWSNDTVRVYRFDNSSAEAIQAAKLVQLSTREETAFLGGVPIPAQARVMPPQTGIQRK